MSAQQPDARAAGPDRALLIAAHEAGMDPDELDELVKELGAEAEPAAVMAVLVARGARRPGTPTGVRRLVTSWQRARIGDLVVALGWSGARALSHGAITRAIGRATPRTSAEAATVIETLKTILARRAAAQQGRRR